MKVKTMKKLVKLGAVILIIDTALSAIMIAGEGIMTGPTAFKSILLILFGVLVLDYANKQKEATHESD